MKAKEIWEVDLRSRKTGDSVETIYSGESHDEACDTMNRWYGDHPELTFSGWSLLEDFVDGSDGVFADIYLVDEDESHGVGKWN